ncbi:uncharacterized protein LOC128843160 [Malaclemys terrapin pileata]|uniref:uncharacterized protein LOC128843160 n=1 Tax=Malaclemys terrapin pileata TaxID=2991368 RepID=UPI0023A8D217|nr:uncharacterized protein LOC128843160 [Malaclemys terrapin pileata]
MTAWKKSHLTAAKTQKADGVRESKCPKRQDKRAARSVHQVPPQPAQRPESSRDTDLPGQPLAGARLRRPTPGQPGSPSPSAPCPGGRAPAPTYQRVPAAASPLPAHLGGAEDTAPAGERAVTSGEAGQSRAASCPASPAPLPAGLICRVEGILDHPLKYFGSCECSAPAQMIFYTRLLGAGRYRLLRLATFLLA